MSGRSVNRFYSINVPDLLVALGHTGITMNAYHVQKELIKIHMDPKVVLSEDLELIMNRWAQLIKKPAFHVPKVCSMRNWANIFGPNEPNLLYAQQEL